MTTPAPAFLADHALRLLVFGGKGGVGKTTCATAAAVALARARPSEQFLLASTDPAHSTRDALGGPDAPLPANLTLVEIDGEAEREAFMAEHAATLSEIATRGTFLDKADIDQFLRLSLPGVDELAAFLRISEWTASGRYACVIVDTAPTGHALRLLELPRLVDQWLDAVDALLAKHRYMLSLFGRRAAPSDRCEAFLDRFRAETAAVRDLLTDHRRTHFVPVLLAEAMSLAETADLLAALDRLAIAAPEAIVNRLIPSAESAPALAAQRADQASQLTPILAAKSASPGSPWSLRTLRGLALRADECVGVDRLTTLFSAAMDADALAAWARAAVAQPRPDLAAPEVDGRLALTPAARLHIVVGKGGVGKTTVSCAAALAAARHTGGRTLLVSVDPAHSVSDALDLRIAPAPTPVAPGLWAMELDAAAEFETFRRAYQEELSGFLDRLMDGADLAFDRDVLERLLDLAPPGLDEVMALVRVIELLDDAKDEAHRFDRLVLDTAPSGHSLRLLALPETIEQWLAGIFRVLLKHQRVVKLPRLQARLVTLSKGLKRLRAWLADPHATSLLTVTIPTELALAETVDLLDTCRRRGLPVAGVVVNLVTPPPDSSASNNLLNAVSAREASVLQRLAPHLAAPPVIIHRGEEPRGIDRLAALADAAFTIPAAHAPRIAA